MPQKFTRNQFIQWLRMNAISFSQLGNPGHIQVEVVLPESISLPTVE